jgi:hypothetical protein
MTYSLVMVFYEVSSYMILNPIFKHT